MSEPSTELPTMAPYLAIARAKLAHWIGVDLRRGGVARSVERHVARSLAKTPIGVAEYEASLGSQTSEAARALIEAATVPHSWLFRDAAQLEALGRSLALRAPGALRVLVAGCAQGEDAYTLAAIALRHGHDVRVLAFDVNDAALERAREGRFGAFQSRELPGWASAYFPGDEDRTTRATDALRRRIRFERHSLVAPIPTPADAPAWDLIVCRNVLIYFERPAAQSIVERLGQRLTDSGLLLLGASDVLAELPEGLRAHGEHGRAVIVRAPESRSVRASAAPRMPERLAPTPSLPPEPRREQEATVDPCVAALDAGAIERARAIARARLAESDDAETRLLAGLAEFAAEAFTEAVAHLRIACRRAPGCWVAWLHLGLGCERLGLFDEAAEAFFRVPLATGPGEELPRGPGELPTTLRATRADLVRLSLRRGASLQRGGSIP